MNILKSQEARDRLARFLNTPFDGNGREFDVEQVFIKLKEVDEAINKNSQMIVLNEEMNLWSEAISVIDDIIGIDGRYKWSESLSDSEEYSYVYVREKNIDYSCESVLKIFVHLTDLIAEYGMGYDEYIEAIKNEISSFEHYDNEQLEKNPDSCYYENLEMFYRNVFDKKYKKTV